MYYSKKGVCKNCCRLSSFPEYKNNKNMHKNIFLERILTKIIFFITYLRKDLFRRIESTVSDPLVISFNLI